MATSTLKAKIEYRLYGIPKNLTYTQHNNPDYKSIDPDPTDKLDAANWGPIPNAPDYFSSYEEAEAWFNDVVLAGEKSFWMIGTIFKAVVVAKTIVILPNEDTYMYQLQQSDESLNYTITWTNTAGGEIGLKVLYSE